MAVFSGGFWLDVAEAIAEGEPVEDVFEGISSLLDMSLLARARFQHGDVRLSLLLTIREFALGRLAGANKVQTDSVVLTLPLRLLRGRLNTSLHISSHAATVDRTCRPITTIVCAAIRFSQANGDVETALKHAPVLGAFWNAIGWLEEGYGAP